MAKSSEEIERQIDDVRRLQNELDIRRDMMEFGGQQIGIEDPDYFERVERRLDSRLTNLERQLESALDKGR